MLLVINAVWGRNLTLVCIHCIDLHSFDECMERVLCWSWTNRPYVYIAWIWHVDAWCSMRSQSYFHALFKYIMYNNNGSALIFIRWLNVWNGCRVGAGQSARTFVLLRVCAWIGRCCWWSTQYAWGCNLTVSYTIMTMMALHWSSSVERMKSVSCWIWWNSMYV